MSLSASAPGGSAPGTDPLDRVGADTLEVMSAAPRYNAWQYRRIAPFLGRRVCEVGSGIGNMSALLASRPLDRLVLTDTDPYYREILHDRFRGRAEVVIEPLTLPDAGAPERFRTHALDTVVALNVVEHIEEDVAALRCMAGMLAPRGRAVVLVPALPALYGSLDEGLGHARRYRKADLRSAFARAGLRVTHCFYYNLVGTLGWFWNARVRRTKQLPLRQVAWFDTLVPLLRLEDFVRLPLGQSLIAVGVRDD
jgi:SAM-dependent methyltransferase